MVIVSEEHVLVAHGDHFERLGEQDRVGIGARDAEPESIVGLAARLRVGEECRRVGPDGDRSGMAAPRDGHLLLLTDAEVFARQGRQLPDSARFDRLGDVALADVARCRCAAHHFEGRERFGGLSQLVQSVVGCEVPGHQFVVQHVVDRAVAVVRQDTGQHRADLEFHALPDHERTQVVLVGDVYAAVIVILDVFLVAAREERRGQQCGKYSFHKRFVFRVIPSWTSLRSGRVPSCGPSPNRGWERRGRCSCVFRPR